MAGKPRARIAFVDIFFPQYKSRLYSIIPEKRLLSYDVL